MPTTPTWQDIALRLGLTLIASGIIGVNRSERGHATGLRTTILVSVAAAVSMIQANLLLATIGKTSEAFSVMDVMRLPLGILSGMGFIGAGAILRRGDMVIGITTAATLWFVTVMGLCFGGGQWGVGLAMLAIGLTVLWTLKWIEELLGQGARGVLDITLAVNGPTDAEVQAWMHASGFAILAYGMTLAPHTGLRKLRCSVRYRRHAADVETPAALAAFGQREGVKRVRWRP